jgi:hypothetical protein
MFKDWERVFFTGYFSSCMLLSIKSIHTSTLHDVGDHYPDLPHTLPVILRKAMQWSDLLAYFHSWSALHNYHRRFPEDLAHDDGNIAVRFWNELKEGVRQEGGDVENYDEIDVEWPVAMILVKRA